MFQRKIPGSATYTGNSSLATTITHYQYKDYLFEKKEEFYNNDNSKTDWLVVEGFKDVESIKKLCTELGVHPLTIEDILNVSQRNKIEETDEYIFAVLKYPVLVNETVTYQYISIVLKENSITTFTDFKNPFIQEIESRIGNKLSLISTKNEDYLFYVLYDMIVDDQISILNGLTNTLEDYESTVLEMDGKMGSKIYTLHKELVLLRNNVKSLRDNVNPMKLLLSKFISNDLNVYLQDVDDHINNLMERANNAIEVCNSLISLYSNELSNKTNAIMKTLTIMSVIFIPLSFLAGVFGMNFVEFEILQYPYGLEVFLGFSVLLVGLMLYYFKKKDWL